MSALRCATSRLSLLVVCLEVQRLLHHSQKIRLAAPRMKLSKFTSQELHLLADSLYWEFTLFEKQGWADSARARQLKALQVKIHDYLDIRET